MDKIEKAIPTSSVPYKESVSAHCSRIIDVLEETIGELRLLKVATREDSQNYWIKKIDGKMSEVSELLRLIRAFKFEKEQ